MDEQSLVKKLWWFVWGAILIVAFFFCVIGVLYLRGRSDELSAILGGGEESTELLLPPTRPSDEAESVVNVVDGELPISDEIIPPTATNLPATATPEPTAIPIPPTAVANTPSTTNLPAGVIGVPRAQAFINIDGYLNEWGASVPVTNSPHVVYSGAWDVAEDVTASWQMQWSADALFIAVNVVDDVHVQLATGVESFMGDSLEIQLDIDRTGDFGAGLSPDDYQWLLSPGDFVNTEAEIVRLRGTSIGQMRPLEGASALVASQKTAEGYIMEAMIPWADLGTSAQDELLIGVTLSVNDNDVVGTKQQVLMKSSSAVRAYTDPTSWGEMMLVSE